ncbi:DUF2199 domain-containing protein [Streptomyces sp. NBC_01538]|uniref:DUF2199 domain-containing protein n=1 Tax=Streptomyces sp. NBC_01538 TaxID=2903897 RepID=UPI003866AB74
MGSGLRRCRRLLALRGPLRDPRQHYIGKGLIEIPAIGNDEVHSPAASGFAQPRKLFSPPAADVCNTPGRESEKPYFGRVTTDLPVHPTTTLNLTTRAYTRPAGERPSVELEPTGRPLAIEHRRGISLDRVREIAAAVLHADDGGQQ